MFKRRKGMSTGTMIAVSTAIIALFSPMLRKRMRGMTHMNMPFMMKGRDHQQHEPSRHQSHTHQESKGVTEMGQMIKQAFTSSQPQPSNHTNQHHSSANAHQPRDSYAQSLHIDENVMNVLDDESIQQAINDIEPK
ncbi:hypothetical protein BACPU_32750 [Bacillus pumilus]|nr:hypothetical protein BACPU_32750 [Bacillus pumilus]